MKPTSAILASCVLLVSLIACAQGSPKAHSIGGIPITNKSPQRKDKVVKTEAQWKKILSPMSYQVLRQDGTEQAGTGACLNEHRAGVFYCAGCGLPLFSSNAKFESGTGWPSFFQPIGKNAVWLKEDDSLGMSRVEVRCARCDGHLGHVFDDGPADKTGLRFCMNAAALKFVPSKSK